MIKMARPNSVMEGSPAKSAVLHGHVLNHIRDVFAAVRGGFEQFVYLFLFDQRDGVGFSAEKVGQKIAFDLIGLVLKAVDFNAEIDHRLFPMQRIERLPQHSAAAMDVLGEQRHGGRNRIQTIGDDPEGRVVDAVEHVVQRGGKCLNVFRVEWRDEGGTQASEDIVHNLIAFTLESAHLLFDSADAVIAALETRYEQLRGPAKDSGMAFKQLKELLVLR